MKIAVEVNGRRHEADVEPRMLLSDFLRHDLGLTGTHVGCEHGVCGACTVHVDGETVRACLMFAVQADRRSVRTVEGLEAEDGSLHPLQQAFHEAHALQCGFCTAGFLMSAGALRARPAGGERPGDPRGARRQPLPLHGLRGDRRGGAQGRARVGMSTPYPRFSDAEMERRHAAVAAIMAARDVGHLLVHGANRFGLAVGWLTRWPVTREAFVVVSPGERDALFVDFYNHVPNAQRIATEADVRPCEGRGIEHPLSELRRRGAAGRRIGVIGPLPWRQAARLGEIGSELVSLDADFSRLRLVKSAEELEWLRIGCELTDRAVEALRAGARPGVDEREARRDRRGRVPRPRRHDAHPLLRHHTDGPPGHRRPGAVAVAPRAPDRRRARLRDQRVVLGPPRPGASHLHGRGGADAPVPGAARRRRRGVRRRRGSPARRRDGGGARRGLRRDRGRRPHDPRRPRARLRRGDTCRRCWAAAAGCSARSRTSPSRPA